MKMVPCQALLIPRGGPICLLGSWPLVKLGLPTSPQEAAKGPYSASLRHLLQPASSRPLTLSSHLLPLLEGLYTCLEGLGLSLPGLSLWAT